MVISIGLSIPYSFLYRKFINYIHLCISNTKKEIIFNFGLVTWFILFVTLKKKYHTYPPALATYAECIYEKIDTVTGA
jgi:hypothetical protein